MLLGFRALGVLRILSRGFGFRALGFWVFSN